MVTIELEQAVASPVLLATLNAWIEPLPSMRQPKPKAIWSRLWDRWVFMMDMYFLNDCRAIPDQPIAEDEIR